MTTDLSTDHSRAAAAKVKEEGAENDLLDRLAADEAFSAVDLRAELNPAKFIGRAPQQVDEFLEAVVEPIRKRYPEQNAEDVELRV